MEEDGESSWLLRQGGILNIGTPYGVQLFGFRDAGSGVGTPVRTALIGKLLMQLDLRRDSTNNPFCMITPLFGFLFMT